MEEEKLLSFNVRVLNGGSTFLISHSSVIVL